MRRHYTVSKWNGMKLYKCLQCEFGSLDEEIVKQHVTRHKPLPEIEVSKPRRRKYTKPDEQVEQQKGTEKWL